MNKKNAIFTCVGMCASAAVGAAASWYYVSKSKESLLQGRLMNSDKHLRLFLLMNQWLQIKQQGKEISSFFSKNGYKNIAVYGMSYVGERLIDELKNSGINVTYTIDRRAERLKSAIPMYSVEDELPEADVIVVTAVFFFEDIKEQLEVKTDIPVISMEDVLFDLMN